jgi:hypothetical protein
MGSQARLEHQLDAVMQDLFVRHPSLCGFVVGTRSVAAKEGGEVMLCLQELAVHPALDGDLPALLEGEIAAIIAGLVEERPDVFGLLSGRTFARALH